MKKRRSHNEMRTAREMAEGKRQAKKNAKAWQASLSLAQNKVKSFAVGAVKKVGKKPPETAPEPRHYTLPPIDPNVTYPKQVRKAGRVAQSYYEPNGSDAHLVRLERQLAVVRKLVEEIW